MSVKRMLLACLIMIDWSMVMMGTRIVRSSGSSGVAWVPLRAPSLPRGRSGQVADPCGEYAGVYGMGTVLRDTEADAPDSDLWRKIQLGSGGIIGSSSSTAIDDGGDSVDSRGTVPGDEPDMGARGAEISRISVRKSKGKARKWSTSRRARSGDVERHLQSQSWENMFCDLALYKQQHGDCNVKSTPSTKLGRWVGWQRGACRHEGVDRRQRPVMVERVSRLEALGIEWDSRDVAWDARFRELLHFRLRFGDSNVPRRWEENRNLGSWVSWVRQRHKLGKLPRVYFDRLQGAALQWSLWDPKQGRHDDWEVRKMLHRRGRVEDDEVALISGEGLCKRGSGSPGADARQSISLGDASLSLGDTHACAGVRGEQQNMQSASPGKQHMATNFDKSGQFKGEGIWNEGVHVGRLRGGGAAGTGGKEGIKRRQGVEDGRVGKGVEKEKEKERRKRIRVVVGKGGRIEACNGAKTGVSSETRAVEEDVVEAGGKLEANDGEEKQKQQEEQGKDQEQDVYGEEGEEMGNDFEEVEDNPGAGREDRGRTHVNMPAAMQLAENGETLGLEAGQYWWQGRATMICNMSVGYAKPPNRYAAAKVEEGLREARLRLGADPSLVTLVRAWGLWHIERNTRGDFSNVTLVSNHSRKISPTVSVSGGPWKFQRCGVKADGGTAMLVFEEGHVILLGSSLGGVSSGESLEEQGGGCLAAFGTTATDSGRLEAQQCLFSLCAGPGLRFARLAKGHVLDSVFVGCGWEGDGAGAVVEECTRK